MSEMAYHSSKICTTAKVPNNINMKKREMEHIDLEDCCSLEEHRKCWANYDHRIDTINSCRSKIHRSGKARHSFTLDENQRVTEYTTKLSTHREINVLGVYHKYLETGN